MHLVKEIRRSHHNDVIIGTMASQITSLLIVYSTAYSAADERKYQSSALLAYEQRIHWSPHKRPVARKMYPFDDVIMLTAHQVQVQDLVVQSPLITWSNIRRYCIWRNDVRDKTKWWTPDCSRMVDNDIYISSSDSTNSISHIQQTIIFTVAFLHKKDEQNQHFIQGVVE